MPELVPGDPVGSRDATAAYLTRRIDALTASADGVNAAGPAPTEAGQTVTGPVVGLLRDRAAALAELREDLRAVPDVSVQTLAQTVRRVRGELVLADPTPTLGALALPSDLTPVAAGIPSCRALGVGVAR